MIGTAGCLDYLGRGESIVKQNHCAGRFTRNEDGPTVISFEHATI